MIDKYALLFECIPSCCFYLLPDLHQGPLRTTSLELLTDEYNLWSSTWYRQLQKLVVIVTTLNKPKETGNYSRDSNPIETGMNLPNCLLLYIIILLHSKLFTSMLFISASPSSSHISTLLKGMTEHKSDTIGYTIDPILVPIRLTVMCHYTLVVNMSSTITLCPLLLHYVSDNIMASKFQILILPSSSDAAVILVHIQWILSVYACILKYFQNREGHCSWHIFPMHIYNLPDLIKTSSVDEWKLKFLFFSSGEDCIRMHLRNTRWNNTWIWP